ncbi:uncharacterized protein SAPINGB_P003101 [Magnusiomyces paraingens]|uniref:Small nuclear ribonucleoprotein G n=1 Tax=Magnusiomyces paraingens TaxID=2606893 RepID=A0A5E8BRU2_9ASCO|nr:uncharacterized protein SAPINGB_P003101 [Saprochaete ingens]VVT51453.1 unnamed protein product [Saprochaete ingens]
MVKAATPEFRKYLDKKVLVQLNGSRKIKGVVRGYDLFLNVVIDEAVEEKQNGEVVKVGIAVIRGNSITSIEALERLS